MLDKNALRDAVRAAIKTGGRIDLTPYSPLQDKSLSASPGTLPNEYCFFLKPEIATLEPTSLGYALDLIGESLRQSNQDLVASAVLPGRYLERHDLMARHYSVINRFSRLGFEALSPAGRAKAAALLGKSEAGPLEVLGGHGFLAEFEYFTPEALCVLHDSLPSTKLDPGGYAVQSTVEGRRIAIVNGFHPLQLAWFYRPSSAVIVFVIRTDLDWRSMRRSVIGPTNPTTAPGSTIRGRLMAASPRLGFQVSALRNGVHASAGPLEAAVEIARYMSRLDSSENVDLKETTFGRLALSAIAPSSLVQAAMNKTIRFGDQEGSTFDLTEEVDSTEALRILSTCSLATSA